jgi:hypothetical protein
MGLRPSVHGSSSSTAKKNSSVNDNESQHSISPKQNDIVNSTTSSSASSTELPPVQRQAWTARGQLLLNFHDVISRAINSPEMIEKCSKIAADMSQEGNSPSTSSQHSLADDYGAEANLIIENKSRRDAEVRNKTIAAGVCVFGLLRGGRGLSSWMRNAAADRAALANRYKFDSLPSSSGTPVEKPLPKLVQVEQPTKLRRFLRLAVDVTISTTIALLSGEFLFIPRPSSYIEDMAKLPLVEGKSLYAEIVCPPLLREYKKVLEQYGRWPIMSGNEQNANTGQGGKPTLTQEDVSLNIIRKFAENCSKRSKYERALLEERDALSNHRDYNSGLELVHRIRRKYSRDKEEWVKLGDVLVPSGGVPEEVVVDLEEEVLNLDEATGDKPCN